MVKPKQITVLLYLGIGFALFLLSGCSSQPDTSPTPTPSGTFEIDPLLYEYYQDLGGQELFGPPVSPLITRDDMFCQYTANALLCQNPLQTGSSRYFLWPIGKELGIGGEQDEDQPFSSYEILPDFFPFYQKMGGAAVLGAPLSSPVYNHDAQRIEQNFERIGLYRRYDEPAGTVHLLPYGKYDCGESCSAYRMDVQFSGIAPYKNSQIGTPFSVVLDQIGGEAVFGRVLTEPYQTADGDLEQIYENVVIYTSPSNPTLVYFRPISRLLNMHTVPPAPYDPSKGKVIFFETGGGLGYHVPIVFDQFIALHGSYDLSGPPIADVIQYKKENVIRQCFENYCLDYFPEAAEGDKVHLAPLGTRYLDLVNPAVISKATVQQKEISLILSEAQPQLPPDQPQRIYILVFEKGSQKGIADISATIILYINQRPVNFTTPPTDNNGWTNITIPAIPGLPNSTIIPYEACLNLSSLQPICKKDSYLIWELQ